MEDHKKFDMNNALNGDYVVAHDWSDVAKKISGPFHLLPVLNLLRVLRAQLFQYGSL